MGSHFIDTSWPCDNYFCFISEVLLKETQDFPAQAHELMRKAIQRHTVLVSKGYKFKSIINVKKKFFFYYPWSLN